MYKCKHIITFVERVIILQSASSRRVPSIHIVLIVSHLLAINQFHVGNHTLILYSCERYQIFL